MNAFARHQLRPSIRDNLKLHMRILHKACKGISMNLITYREPNRIYLTDACEIGMVGFISKGRARRWKITKEYWGCAHINLLEFCEELVSIWIDIIEDTLDDNACLLSMGDIPTAIGWLHKAHTPAPNENPQSTLAKTRLQRKLTYLLIDNEHLMYSPWFPGSANFIPDILSRDWHLDDGKILNLLTHIFPTHLHPYFRLSQVTIIIDYFLCSVLQSLPKPTKTWTKPKTIGFALEINGVSSCDQSAL